MKVSLLHSKLALKYIPSTVYVYINSGLVKSIS